MNRGKYFSAGIAAAPGVVTLLLTQILKKDAKAEEASESASEAALESASSSASSPPTDRLSELREAYRMKRAVMLSRTEWEARRLQQIFKEVDREMALQKDLELRVQGERLQTTAEARIEATRTELLLDLKAEAAKARADGLKTIQRSLELYEEELGAKKDRDIAEELETRELMRRQLLETAEQDMEDHRMATNETNLQETSFLMAEVESCLDRIRKKTQEHARQAAVHRRTAAALHCAQCLETFQSASNAADALLASPLWTTTTTTSFDAAVPLDVYTLVPPVVTTALMAVPEKNLRSGVPEIQHLEARFHDKIQIPTKRWLLVPKDMDGLLGHGLAWIAEKLGLTAPIVNDDAVTGYMTHLHLASDALEHHGNLRTCVDHLGHLPTKHPFTNQPSPALDWLHDARARLLADQAAALLRAKTSLLNSEQVLAATQIISS